MSKPAEFDFSNIDSRERAEELFHRGELELLYMRPLELGGLKNPLNTLFVPIGIAAIKADTDNNVIAPLAAEGKVTNYQATAEYQGASVIPTSITIVASDPGKFSMTINIWGDALNQE